MKTLLLIAHGSRKETANEEVRELANRIRQHGDNDYAAIVPAFLEFAEPNVLAGIDSCVKMGAKDITVMPYFLSSGSHVTRDIPKELNIANERYPDVNLHLTQHFGAADGVVESVINCAKKFD